VSGTDDLELLGEGRQAEVFAWGEGVVLRLFRPGRGGSIDAEEVAMRAALAGGAPVPAVLGRATVDGRVGLVIERVDGDDEFTRLGRAPWQARRVAARVGRLHASLHTVEAPEGALPPLASWLTHRIDEAVPLPGDLARLARDVLHTLPDGDRLLHGDFHPGNVHVGAGGPAVIDWTNATRGDPDGDVARTTLMLRFGAAAPGMPRPVRAFQRVGRGAFASVYTRSYQRSRPLHREQIERWMIPHAAARLAEGIDEEVDVLLAFLRARAG
jgi:aminoglycoside phosphotransferase (APT) family kinase protein